MKYLEVQGNIENNLKMSKTFNSQECSPLKEEYLDLNSITPTITCDEKELNIEFRSELTHFDKKELSNTLEIPHNSSEATEDLQKYEGTIKIISFLSGHVSILSIFNKWHCNLFYLYTFLE